MNVKDLVIYVTPNKMNGIGIIEEILTIEDSVDKNIVGKTLYCIAPTDKRLSEEYIFEDQIETCYSLNYEKPIEVVPDKEIPF